jgi:hypothetical protein
VEQTVAQVLDVSRIQSRVGSEGTTARIADDVAGMEPQQHWQRVTDDNPQESVANVAP